MEFASWARRQRKKANLQKREQKLALRQLRKRQDSPGRWASLGVLFDFMDKLGHQIDYEDCTRQEAN